MGGQVQRKARANDDIAVGARNKPAGEVREQSLAKSIGMLKAVLAGRPYASVAAQWSLSRTAVEQRVKRLARELQEIVGVEGLEDEVPSLDMMRRCRAGYLEALEHYRPECRIDRHTRRSLSEQDFERLLRVTRRASNCPQRDLALVLILFATAAKPLEIARLSVSDYLREDGSVREESVMRAQAANNGRPRPLYFANQRLVEALDAYLLERLRLGHGIGPAKAYRGLDPQSPLFLADDGRALPIRVRQLGNRRHHLCAAILDIYRRIFARAGLHGISALSARRLAAQRLAQGGCDVEQIAEVLGVKDRSSLRKLVAASRPGLKAAVKTLV